MSGKQPEKLELFTKARVPAFVAQIREALKHRFDRYRKPVHVKTPRVSSRSCLDDPEAFRIANWYRPDGIAP